MVQRLQENGAAGLWSFELDATGPYFQKGLTDACPQEGCEAIRVGWADIPRQPTLRGEWQFSVQGSSSDSDVPISA